MTRTPILMYHEVGAPRCAEAYPSWTVPAEAFREHLAALDEAGYTGMSVARWLALRERPAASLRPVVITFDDGFLGNVEQAIPALCDLGWSATFFVISGKMGEEGYAEPGDWRAARLAGMDVASHSATHPFLAIEDAETVRRELADSRAALEEATGGPVVGFSWPNGDAHQDGKRLLRETGYAWAATSRAAFAGGRCDPYALPRLPVRSWHTATDLRDLVAAGASRRARMIAVYEAKRLARILLGRDRYARIQSQVSGDRGDPVAGNS